jgi:hypothetical protein
MCHGGRGVRVWVCSVYLLGSCLNAFRDKSVIWALLCKCFNCRWFCEVSSSEM